MQRYSALLLTIIGCALISLLVDKQHHLVISLVHLQEALSEVHKEHAKMKLLHLHIQRSNENLRRSMEQQYQDMVDITMASRSRIIRIKGIPENEAEDLEDEILDLMLYLGIQADRRDIERANRVGRPQQNRTSHRQIVCELHSHEMKLTVLRKSIMLRNSNIAILDDLISNPIPGVPRPDHTHEHHEHECGLLDFVEAPEDYVRTRKQYGAWFMDSESSDDRVWVMEHFFKNKKIFEYNSLSDLLANRKSRTIDVKDAWGGTGHVVYNNSLYYNKFNTSIMIKYDLETGETLHEYLPKAAYGNQMPYQILAFTDLDFAVDEEGLWVIYSTYENTGHIVVSKLNHKTLEVEATYRTNWRKKWSGNAFMACGVLYVLKKADRKNNNFLNYAYDTHTKQWKHLKIPIELKYGFMASLTYNPKDKRLYGWDKDYMVVYDLEFFNATARNTWINMDSLPGDF